MKSFAILAALVAAASCFSIPSERELLGHWEQFKATHAKTYDSPTEENFRMKIFKDRTIFIAKHNERFARGEVTYTVGINQFADMHSHEITERLNGYRMERKQQSGLVHDDDSDTTGADTTTTTTTTTTTSSPPSLPEAVDWRTEGIVSEVKDQGHCDASWAFSAVGALEAQFAKRNNNTLVPLSAQNLIDCDRKSSGCGGGGHSYAIDYVAAAGGIATEADYPFEGKTGRCRYLVKKYPIIRSVHLAEGHLFDDDDVAVFRLKQAVATVGPVAVSFDGAHDSFRFYKSGIYYDPTCWPNPTTAALVVGYGSDGEGQDYWIMKNSWGTHWGEQGYVRFARNKPKDCGVSSSPVYPEV